ncbi:hypothetical protein M4I32_13380 [Microbacterium sp. LRZ72]|uniref:hypothetical protein n=1 Tax=Microbacterium sp. LRZ72 TaxID=2942481 RepID=UPI0029B090F5|nr:hypothetical protein [Microbacterium sp. LRZ72]MDX2377792.1 hypothetical protein [Microbacterium sp. LRZ72]
MTYLTSQALEETGYVLLDPIGALPDAAEWLDLEYTGWRSAGVTRFAPLASYSGDLDCNGFWNHTPPRTDKDGVWVTEQVERAPTLARLAQEPGANIGRCRVVELQSNSYVDALYNLHQDDNNRLNPPGTGWVVRGYLNLTDDPDSVLILREDRLDAGSEVRLPLSAGSRIVVDTQRFWHAVWHPGPAPRYALVVSWTSGPELDAYIAENNGTAHPEQRRLDPAFVEAAQRDMVRRLEERRRTLAGFDAVFTAGPIHPV